MEDIKSLVEVLLFATPEPLTETKFKNVFNHNNNYNLNSIIKKLNNDYNKYNRGFIIKKIGGGYQLLSLPKYHVYIDKLLMDNRKILLSRSAYEGLAIIAYKQPVSKLEIETIRGVESGSILNTLIKHDLIYVKGRAKRPGRPLLFGTTKIFLQKFGLNNISDLPNIKEISDISTSENNLDKFVNNNET